MNENEGSRAAKPSELSALLGGEGGERRRRNALGVIPNERAYFDAQHLN